MSQMNKAQDRFDTASKLRELLVDGLELPGDPELLDFDTPLFGRGLELDSLDTLEIVSLLDEEFGVQVDDEDRIVFGSINRLVDQVHV